MSRCISTDFFKKMYMKVWQPLDVQAFTQYYSTAVLGYSNETIVKYSDIKRHLENLKEKYHQINPDIHRVLCSGNHITAWFTQHAMGYDGEEKLVLETMVTYEVIDQKVQRFWFVWDNIDPRDYFNEQTHPKSAEDKASAIDLTRRERETLYYLIRYFNQKEIATALGISPRTVEVYINSLKSKFGVAAKRSLIKAAIAQGYAAPIQELYDLAMKHGMIEPL